MESLFRYYSHASYRNGFSRDKSCTNPNFLTFETGFYGLDFDIQDLTKLWFKTHNDNISYSESFLEHRMESLKEENLNIQISKESVIYTCRSMRQAVDCCKPFNGNVILWEAGKISQRFELLNLDFQDPLGTKLGGSFSLSIQVWPDSFALTLIGKEIKADLEVSMSAKEWNVEQCYSGDTFQLTLSCDILKRSSDASFKVTTDALCEGHSKTLPQSPVELKTEMNALLNSYETEVNYFYFLKAGCLCRKFKADYTDIHEYDDYDISLVQGTTSPTPYVLSLGMPANVTGMCPMILTEEGIPTGIPIQLSKNWHWEEKGAYAKLYTILPTSGRYILRIAYGFYGTLPSASHAQLCLWGYGQGSSGRWDQLAIGCWGETFCIDSEFSCGVNGQIRDVRGLMMGSKPEQKWNWTHCAWGGDWLRAYRSSKKLFVNHVRVAYLAHGPCLTNVRFHGYYGDEAVKFVVGIRTLRTDDYCRTFLEFKYEILKDISLEEGYLHSMLQRTFHTPTVAYGNSAGLIREKAIPDGLENKETFIENKAFEGNAPYWVAFPDSDQFPPNQKGQKQMPSGTKNMIVRTFNANVSGKQFKTPAFSLVNKISGWSRQGNKPSITTNLELPNGIRKMAAGDSIKMVIEWTTHSREAQEYYGPNGNYRSFLSLNPRSWKIPFREAQLNDSMLSVAVVVGGTLLNKYPIQINVTNESGVKLRVTAGVGAVPMEFSGLKHTDYRLHFVNKKTGKEDLLDQSSKVGNDYWQTEFDFKTMTYIMTFNPMLGDDWETTWILKNTHQCLL
jgi:hypothetical protein